MKHTIVAKHPHTFGVFPRGHDTPVSLPGKIDISGHSVRFNWLEFVLRDSEGVYIGHFSLPLSRIKEAIQEYEKEGNTDNLIDQYLSTPITE